MADRTFTLKFVGDIDDAKRALKNVEGSVTDVKDTTTSAFKTIATAVSAVAIVEFGKSVVSSASDQEQAIGAVNSVFKDTADTINDFGKTTAENMGISRAEFSQSAATMGALLKNAGIPLDDVASKTLTLSERAADLASMYGGTVPDAMNAMQSALKGEMDPLEAYGVSIKQATVEAKAMSMGLVKNTVDSGKLADAQAAIKKTTDAYTKAVKEHGAGSEEAKTALAAQEKAERRLDKVMEGKKPKLDAATQAQATYALILEQSADAQGNFAKESDTLSGQTARMKAQFTDLQADIGANLLPILVKLAEILRGMIGFVVDNQGWLLPLVGGILAIVAAVKAWEIAQAAWTVATTAATAVQWAFNAAFAANPIGLIVIGIAAVIAAIVLLYTKVDWFRAGVDAAIDGVVAAFQWLWDMIQNIFRWVRDNWPLLLAILTGPFGLAVLAIQRNWDSITNGIKTAIDAIKSALSTVWDIISYPFVHGTDVAKSAINSVIDLIASMYNKINNALSGLSDVITYPFRIAMDAVKSLWNNTIGKISFTIPSWVPGVGGKGFNFPKMAKGGIVNRPTIALLGEAGPEAVVPLNKAGAGGFGSVTINVYALTANAEVGRKVWEALREYERTSGKAIA